MTFRVTLGKPFSFSFKFTSLFTFTGWQCPQLARAPAQAPESLSLFLPIWSAEWEEVGDLHSHSHLGHSGSKWPKNVPLSQMSKLPRYTEMPKNGPDMTNWTKVAQIGKNALRILLLKHNLSWPPWKMCRRKRKVICRRRDMGGTLCWDYWRGCCELRQHSDCTNVKKQTNSPLGQIAGIQIFPTRSENRGRKSYLLARESSPTHWRCVCAIFTRYSFHRSVTTLSCPPPRQADTGQAPSTWSLRNSMRLDFLISDGWSNLILVVLLSQPKLLFSRKRACQAMEGVRSKVLWHPRARWRRWE